jgi:twitching motility protein PilT
MFKSFMDKRKARRKEGASPFEYAFVDEEGLLANALIRDISVSGFAIESKEVLNIGQVIKGETVLSFLEGPVKFIGKIVRIKKMGNDRYVYGVVFDQVEQFIKEKIDKYVEELELDSLFMKAVNKGAQSIHLLVGSVPVCRIDSQIFHLDVVPVSQEDMERMVFSILNEKQKADLYRNCELDLAYILHKENRRFRINLCFDKGKLAIVARIVSNNIKSFGELRLPKILDDIVNKKHGMILVTGPVDSGKSTTIASIIENINVKRESIIVCIEDPIECIYTSKSSLICQRDVGLDTLSFSNALKSSLRQDADVVFVGEMRDLDSISQAISAAEAGHLVFSTMHTSNVIDCINRIIDIFPDGQQTQVRVQLSLCLEYVIGQCLIPRADGKGRIVATEVLVVTPAIKNLIRNAHTEQILGYQEAGSEFGMYTMDNSLKELYASGLITKDTAYAFAYDKKKFENY